REHIGELAVVLLSPELFVLPHVHQLRADSQILAALQDTPRDYRAHPQGLSGAQRVARFPLIVKNGTAGDHTQGGKLRQVVNDAFGQTVREVLRLLVVILIIEWQDSDGFNRYFSGSGVPVECE